MYVPSGTELFCVDRWNPNWVRTMLLKCHQLSYTEVIFFIFYLDEKDVIFKNTVAEKIAQLPIQCFI